MNIFNMCHGAGENHRMVAVNPLFLYHSAPSDNFSLTYLSYHALLQWLEFGYSY